MRLPFLRPKSDAGGAERPVAGGADAGALQLARTQARRRLIGALVLLVAAVVGFPLLFETLPRPLPGAVSIENGPVVTLNGAAPVARMAGAGTPAPAAAATTKTAPALAAPTAVAPAASAPAPTPSPASAAPLVARVPVPALAPAPAPAPAKADSADKAEKVSKADRAPTGPAAAASPATTATTRATTTAATSAAASNATEAPAADAAARWVVQVGAYNDMDRMRKARQKAEKLGFKTYITEVDTPTGRRTRVRLGPFAGKKEADAAAVKVKAAGMDANVLSL